MSKKVKYFQFLSSKKIYNEQIYKQFHRRVRGWNIYKLLDDVVLIK